MTQEEETLQHRKNNIFDLLREYDVEELQKCLNSLSLDKSITKFTEKKNSGKLISFKVKDNGLVKD